MMRIPISAELQERYQRYADVTQQSIRQAIQEALTDWMGTVGEGRMEVITGCPCDTEAGRMGVPVEIGHSC